jgi:hypothetical protein
VKRCKTCKWWRTKKYWLRGTCCQSIKVNDTVGSDITWCGPEFGCVHHEEKEEETQQ